MIFTGERGFGTQRPDKPFTHEEYEQGVRSVFNGLGNIFQIKMEGVLRETRPKATFPEGA